MSDGWDVAAQAWIASQGEEGDFGRRWVMDAPMLERVRLRPYARAPWFMMMEWARPA